MPSTAAMYLTIRRGRAADVVRGDVPDVVVDEAGGEATVRTREGTWVATLQDASGDAVAELECVDADDPSREAGEAPSKARRVWDALARYRAR